MLTKEDVVARPGAPPLPEEKRPTPVHQEPRPEFSILSLLGRLLLLALGFGLAFTGWMLAMSVILVFIGFPLFFFGLAVMQAAWPSLSDVKT